MVFLFRKPTNKFMLPKERNSIKHKVTVLLFLSPWLVGFCAFILVALLNSFRLSFTAYNLFKPPKFIGLSNYKALFKDEIFIQVLGNTIFYTFFAFILNFTVAFLLSLFIFDHKRNKYPGVMIFKTLYFIPYIIPFVAYAIVWKFMYNPQFGIVNYFISIFGGTPQTWLTSKSLVKPSIIFANILLMGPQMIIFYSGLQDIPESLFDSLKIDGANWFHRLKDVIVPILSPIMIFNGILLFIYSFQVFALPLVMTEGNSSTTTSCGGPAHSSTFYLMYLYDTAFTRLDLGFASAMAWVMFIILLICSSVFLYLQKHKTFYMGDC